MVHSIVHTNVEIPVEENPATWKVAYKSNIIAVAK